MARKSKDPAIEAHLEWLGFVRPTGLVVSAPALIRAGAVLNTHDREGQRRLVECAVERELGAEVTHSLPDFRSFAREVLGWSFSSKGYAGTEERPIPDELEVHLPEFGETLRPDFAVIERDLGEDALPWQLLVRILDEGEDFDAHERIPGSTLDASPHGRMERLLRQTEVPAGLLFNGRAVRLISAPRGESSGWLDFRVEEMVQTAGRPIAAAMRMLLSERRLLSLPKDERLSALLRDSRAFQNEVSEKLAEQVLHALYELVRGMQAAHDQSKGTLLRDVIREDPDQVYRALLTVLLRTVFLLYAEERDMLPSDEVYQRYYGIAGLHERLREDAAQYPDTLDQRYGAWAQLIGLFRMIYDGADLGSVTIPRRHGVLFDPDRFPFLEGRPSGGSRQIGERIEPPLVPDGTVFRALEKLLILDGERISYRALDVEQIGSVYETMMGFRLETANGRSLAIRSKGRMGAPATVNLEALLEVKPGKRRKWLQGRADRKVSASVNRELKAALSVTELQAALLPVTDKAATPDLVPPGAMILQPSEERRKTGSHYTPRSLTEPIVRKTLEPLLAGLEEEAGGPPRPKQILDLKICDPAMGSGAFLVETCRQLGDALLDAWKAGDGVPPLPPDEDEVVFARRKIAQRCIYGVDRNPVAVDLAKVSLWLVTLARDHAFTFLDHALRHGDSLVGLSRKQIELFHWDADSAGQQGGLEAIRVHEHVDRLRELRAEIRSAEEGVEDSELRDLWDRADHEVARVRLFADLVISAYLEGSTRREREERRVEYARQVVAGTANQHRERQGSGSFATPFHWELEFPEALDRTTSSGFDAFVGNPPFMGGTKISTNLGSAYRDWLYHSYPGARGRCDLVGYFFRRSFELLQPGGAFGLIASNSIAEGDTREGGLTWICQNGGDIYSARKRVRWPGRAAVVVSIIHCRKGVYHGQRLLDGRSVQNISAHLFHRGGHESPHRLDSNSGLSFTGFKIYAQGLLFDDTDTTGVCSSLGRMRRLLEDPKNHEVIFPYIGGREINSSPTQDYHRYVIDFGELERGEAKQWTEVFEVCREKVVPERAGKSAALDGYPFWRFWRTRPELRAAIEGLERVLVTNCGATPRLAFAFQPASRRFSHALAVFPLDSYSAFSALQCRPHEIWARFFGSSMKDDLRYTPSDVFETFPFPVGWTNREDFEEVGEAYYSFRADVMVRNDEGLTNTYNRFHHPNERDPEIIRLRELHTEMDRAVLAAYGWTDIPTDCDFLLDYEIDEENWNPRKKKPWRYRWPDEVHDEVLARLLELNEERAKAEEMGVISPSKESTNEPSKKAPADEPSENLELFYE